MSMPKLYRQPKFVLLLLLFLFGVLVAGCWYGYQKQLKNLEKQLYDLQHKMQTQRFMIHSRLFSTVPIRTFQYLFVLLFLACLSQAQTIRYVKQNGTGDGSSWANASGDLQAMINASGTSQVWVAKGTYYPTTNPTDRAASFVMKNGVAIYGGFMGTETNLNDRNWATNLTILSGDIDHATDPLVVTGSGITLLITGNSGNSYHVIFNDNNGLNSTAVLDGFTITGGYSSDAGGGMYNNYSSPSIKNCSFSGNQADLNGGGMCNNYSSPSLANCSFSVNWAIMFGAGMENTESSPSLVNCHFSGNKAGNSGGVMYNYYSSPNFMNCSFSGNHANSAGGAMLNIYSLSSFTNCSFSGNQVFHRGGGMENVYSSPSLINCSFSGNQAEQGGGISNYLTSSPSLKNCILWGNSSEVFNDGSSYPTYTKTLVKDLVVGGFQGTEDPLFVNQTVVGLSTAGDLRLQPCSPVINAGNNADNTTATDLDGNARLFDMTIDLGAYENQSALVITPSVSISHPTTCGGAEGRISLSGFVNSTTYSVTYKKNTNVVAAADFTSNENGVITLTDLGAGSYTDIVATYRACVSNAATATLTDPTIPTATISGTTTVCQNGSSPNITFTGQTGITPYTFTYKINEGVSQTVQTTGSNNSVTVPVPTNALGTFSYRLESVSTTNNCSQTQTGSATVTVNPLPTATISGTTTVCRNSPSPSITFTGSNATAPYTFTYKINDGPAQTVTTTGGNSVTVAAPTGTAGTFVYSLISVSESSTISCSQEQSGSATVTVNPLPTATISGTTTVCRNSPSPSITFTGSNATAPYTFTYKINDGAPQTVTTTSGNSVTVAAPTGTAGTIVYSLVSVSESSTTSCSQEQSGSATVTVNPLPTATISGTTTVCRNSASPMITFTGANAAAPYTFTYKINDGAPQTVTTTGGNSVTVAVPTVTAGTFVYSLVSVSESSSTACSQEQSGSATVTVNPLPTASISGTTTVCQNSPSPTITFTGADATAPYTFTYKINDGAPQTVTTTGGNSVTVAAPTVTAGTFVYSLVSVSESSSTACSQEQSGSVEVRVQGKPTITLTTLQQTLNEGNSQTFCDTDANPVNGLQFTVSGSCVTGSPIWRVQVGSGSWSDWSPNVPVSQLSNNQPHRYQAACDANCPVTYTNPIEVTINYRASTPQNVSLVADGVTVAVGETKEICNIEGNAITFNASCASGELVLYSVDGGEYSSTLPPQLVDGQYHNYRVRCRKSDGTVSCVETESGVMRLRIVSSSLAAPVASLNVTSGCGSPVAFSGITNCGALTTIWYNAVTNVALPSLPNQTPTETTSYYARCQTENGCVSEKSNVVTFTLTPTQVAPVITASQEIVCTGTTVTISANCPAGSQTFWNTGVTASSFEISFSNVTKQSYWAKCLFEGGCQSAESVRKDVYWNAFVVTLVNVGQTKSAIKTNDRAAWSSQFVTRDGGPELEQSTQVNPTLYFAENVNKTAPRYWTVNVEACGLSNDGSLTFDMLATPETGVIRSFNTHENNAPYFMYANRDGWTELYGQNHPAYGFYQDNGVGSNVYDAGLPKGLYKLGIRYWDQKGWGSIYPSTRKPQGNVLAYQEYWFRIQSKDGVGVGAARQGVSVQEARGEEQGSDNGKQITDNGTFATVLPNPVTNILRLKVQNSKGQVVQTSLTDASGREVLRRQFVAETNTHQEEFGVSELPTAMYFLQVTTETQQATLKVVKAP